MQIIPLIEIFISSQNLDHKWGFNTNLLEANVINIILLVSGLIYVLKKFLGESLLKRRKKVLETIQEAEDQLEQAKNRLAESEKQLHQSKIIIKQIQQEAIVTAQRVRQSILNQGKLDVERLTNTGRASISAAENQIRKQIQEQITALAIKCVFTKLKTEINPEIRTILIDKSIAQLENKL